MTSKVNPRSSQSLNKQACYKCNQNVFQLEKISVGDHLLHESCFVCETCNNRLSSSNYVEYEGAYFCIKHSAHINQEEKTTDTGDSEKTCPFCKKHVLTAEGIILDNEEIVHRSCFTCSECNTPLSLGKFHIIEQKFYCTRHYYTAAADSGDINGRKKARDLYTGSLDADPLLSSLEDLKIQEQKQKEAQDTPRGSDANNSKQASPSKFPENSSYPSSEERKETDDNEVKDVPSASDDTARDFSVSHSENALDTEENTDGVSVSEKSDCAPGKPDTEANANTVEDSTETGTPAQLKRSRSRKKKELKAHGTSRKEVNSLLDEKESKKKPKKKRKTDRSEADDTEETNDAGKTKRRRDKLSRSKQKQNSSQKLDELEEDKDKKKKGKRGLFSITKKKQKSGSSVRKGSEDASHSPSLTSFVSSRFRKSKKDALADQNTRPVSPKLSPAQQQNKYSKPSEDSETEDSEEEALDSLQELAPLAPSDKKNRLSRLNRGDSKDSKSGRTGTSFDTPTKPAKIQPVSLSTPVAFTPLHSLSTCANTQDEDLPLATLNVPKTKDNEGLEWSSYELMRKLPKIELNLPEDVITEPSDVKERIMQSGFFVPSVLKFGLIGAQRRILDFLSILATTYPFGIQIAAGANVAPKAVQILQDRHGESFKQVSITELLSMDLDWIFVGSTYNDNTENILQALQSGKNVFCEKPVCFSVSDCLKLRDAHSKSGKKFYGGFVWRLVPFYQEIFDVLRSNILGNIVSMEINNLMSPSDTGPLMSTSSRLRKYCRTSLFDTFCFEIDIVNWLLESIPSKVGSFSGLDIFLPKNKPKTEEEMEPYLDWTYKPVEENLPSDPFTSEKDIDDNHVIMMEYRNNVRVTCHINTNSAFPQRRILICGLKGTLEGDLYTGTIRYKTIQEQYETNIIQVTPGMAHGGGDQQIMENLMDATKNLPTTQAFEGEEIFPSVITALGADQSKQEGSIIDLEVQWKQLGI